MKKIDKHVSCPSCGWNPDGKKHWQCLCGHEWNVFSTAGRCPACFRQWEKTQCATTKAGGCNDSSPHLEWYGNLDGWLQRELKQVPVAKPAAKGSTKRKRRGTH